MAMLSPVADTFGTYGPGGFPVNFMSSRSFFPDASHSGRCGVSGRRRAASSRNEPCGVCVLNLLLSAFAAFLVCATLLFVLRPVAAAVGLLDRPGGHKRHRGEIPVIGGIAIFVGAAVAALGGDDLGHHGVMLLVTAAMLVGLGVVDDRFDLPASVRLMGHLTAAVLLVYGSGLTVPSLGNLFGSGAVPLGWVAWPFTVVACIALINAFNMLDGMDGLAGGVGVVAFGGVAVLAASHAGSPAALFLAACMVGALSAFLLFNVPASFNRGMRTFMGDAGSTLLGFVLAALALGLVQPTRAGISPVCILWLVPIPIFELFASTTRRALQGKSPLAADNGHFHHRLMAAGFSVRAIFFTYFTFSVLSVAGGVWACRADHPESWLFAGFGGLFAFWMGFLALAPRIAGHLPHGWHREHQTWA